MKKIQEVAKLVAGLTLAAAALVISAKFMGAPGLCLAAAFVGWVDSNVGHSPVRRGNPALVAGALARGFVQTWTKATTDGDGTIYYIAEISANAILSDLKLNSAALTGLSSAAFGFYRTDGTAAGASGADKSAALMALTDISGGYAIGSELNAMSAVTIANKSKKVWELLGVDITKKDETYLIALTCPTAGSATGALSVQGKWIQG